MVLVRDRQGRELYVEDFRIRVFQRLRLPPAAERLRVLEEAGWNTFRIPANEVFIDMLTDSGVNAISLEQLSNILGVGMEDAYAGGRAYYLLLEAFRELVPHKHLVLAHQGRAAENLVFRVLMRGGRKRYVFTNVHFTTTRAIIENAYGGVLVELPVEEAFDPESEHPFKGNMDVARLEEEIRRVGKDNVAAVRMEYAANLLGGQPFSMKNYEEVREVCDRYGLFLVADVSMADWQLALMRRRDPKASGRSARELFGDLMELTDVAYASARKGFYVRGGFITVREDEGVLEGLRTWQVVFEGHPTYGGMSLKEVAALAEGLRMALDDDLPYYELELIEHAVRKLDSLGIPVVKPPGGLGIHVDAMRFLPHVPLVPGDDVGGYPAAALAAATYLVSGVRGMERGQLSMDRDPSTGAEIPVKLDLVRFAMPRKTYVRGHVEYLVDRLAWLSERSHLIGGLRWIREPPIMRFFEGVLEDVGGWGEGLFKEYVRDLGDL
ncbi:MAG: tryptophanase [Desulfurococcaceae archaeon]